MSKKRADMNLAALKMRQKYKQKPQPLTQQELETLRSFTGWGGMADVFKCTPSPNPTTWPEKTRKELDLLLSPAEIREAYTDLRNGFYTNPDLARTIWDVLDALGFSGGRVLEPAVGRGVFIETCPFPSVEWTLVEKNSVSADICRMIHQVEVYERDFADVIFPGDYFDLAISNVPFDTVEYRYHPTFGHLAPQLHNLFILKMLWCVRPGGLVAVITSTGTLDSKNIAIRKEIARAADLKMAVRLPEGAIAEMNSTKVSSDLLIFQRKKKLPDLDAVQWQEIPEKLMPQWITSCSPFEVAEFRDEEEVPEETKEFLARFEAIAEFRLNFFYIANPENLLGRCVRDSLYGGRAGLEPDERDLHEAIMNIATAIPVFYDPDERREEQFLIPPALQNQPPNCYVIHRNQVFWFHSEGMDLIRDAREAEGLYECITLWEAFDRVCEAQSIADNEILSERQESLNDLYDDFVTKWGHLHSKAVREMFGKDSRYYTFIAMEESVNNTWQKASLFTKRITRAYDLPERGEAESLSDAIIFSLRRYGRVSMNYIAELLDCTYEEIETEIDKAEVRPLFFDPDCNDWVLRENYLSGNIRKRLSSAKAAGLEKNIEALTEILPLYLIPKGLPLEMRQQLIADLGEENVNPSISAEWTIKLASRWIPSDILEKFSEYFFGIKFTVNSFFVGETLSSYEVTMPSYYEMSEMAEIFSLKNRIGWSAKNIFEHAINGTWPRVFDTLADGSRLLNVEATTEANRLVSLLRTDATEATYGKDSFSRWVWKDYERVKNLTIKYNNLFNSFALREYNGDWLTLPGTNPDIKFESHQKNAVWRALQSEEGLAMGLFWFTGAGKSYTMMASVMEAVRLGLVGRGIIICLNDTVEQMEKEFRHLYPLARLKVGDRNSQTPERRKRFVAELIRGDYDCAILPHSWFIRGLAVHPLTVKEFVDEQLDLLDSVNPRIADDTSDPRRLAGARTRLENLYKKLQADAGQSWDNTVFIHQLSRGGLMLCIDEAHQFKNVPFYTLHSNLAGINPRNTKRALDCYWKTRLLIETGNKVILSTATPISNSLSEFWVVLIMTAPRLVRELGIENFDACAATFFDITVSGEIDHTGRYKDRVRCSRLINRRAIVTAFRLVADVIQKGEIPYSAPKVHYFKEVSPPSPEQHKIMKSLVARAETLEDNIPADRKAEMQQWAMANAPEDDNHLWITFHGRANCIHAQTLMESAPDFADNKLAKCIENVVRIYQATTSVKGVQVIFCDLSVYHPKSGTFDAHKYLREGLIAIGIPESEIVMSHEFKNTKGDRTKFNDALEELRQGTKRVFIATTYKGGTGLNYSNRLCAAHMIDPTWRPLDDTQRIGRIERRNNEWTDVAIIYYLTRGVSEDMNAGFDAFMWNLNQQKQVAIVSCLSGKVSDGDLEELAPSVASYAMLKSVATGDDRFMKLRDAETKLGQLKQEAEAYHSRVVQYRRQVAKVRSQIDLYGKQSTSLSQDVEILNKAPENPPLNIQGDAYDLNNKKQLQVAQQRLFGLATMMGDGTEDNEQVGSIYEFDLTLRPLGDKTYGLFAQREGSVYGHLLSTKSGKIYATRLSLDYLKQNTAEQLEEIEEKRLGAIASLAELEKINLPPWDKEEQMRQQLDEYEKLKKELQEVQAKIAQESANETKTKDNDNEDIELFEGLTGAAEWQGFPTQTLKAIQDRIAGDPEPPFVRLLRKNQPQNTEDEDFETVEVESEPLDDDSEDEDIFGVFDFSRMLDDDNEEQDLDNDDEPVFNAFDLSELDNF